MSNPQNCERNPTACSADQYRDPTSTGQTLDRQENPMLCQASEYVQQRDPSPHPQDCTLDATPVRR